MAHRDEAGNNHRREHDRKTRSYEGTTGNPYHLSKAVRVVGGVLVVIALVAAIVGLVLVAVGGTIVIRRRKSPDCAPWMIRWS